MNIKNMLDIYTTIGGISTLAIIANGIWFITNLKSKKKIAKSKAKLSEETAKSSSIDNDIKTDENSRKTIDWAVQKIKEISYESKKHQKKSDRQQMYIILLVRHINEMTPYYCAKISCLERAPKWGEYKVPLPRLDDFLKGEDGE